MVVPYSDQPVHRRAQEAFRLLGGVGAPKDVLVMTHEEFSRKQGVVTSLPATVEREGRLVYAS